MFTCVELASRGELTVPAYVLSTIAATVDEPGYLFLLAHPLSTRFRGAGVDLGYFVDFGTENIEVAFR